MGNEIIHPNRWKSLAISVFALLIVIGVIATPVKPVYRILGSMMGLIVVFKIGLRAFPGCTYLQLTSHGILRKDYFIPTFIPWKCYLGAGLEQDTAFNGRKERPQVVVFFKSETSNDHQSLKIPTLSLDAVDLIQKLAAFKQIFDEHQANGESAPPPLTSDFVARNEATQTQKGVCILGYACAVASLITCFPLFGLSGFFIGRHLEAHSIKPHGYLIKTSSVVLGVAGLLIALFIVVAIISNRPDPNVEYMRSFVDGPR